MVNIFADTNELIESAIQDAISTLNQAIDSHGNAVWVLAGGTIPATAYQIIADNYLDAVDWSKVTFVMGDERIVPLDSPDSNWFVAEKNLLKNIPVASFLRPLSNDTAENGAGEYAEKLSQLPKTADGLPRFDLVWLGMGEDGHTLSLFPGHPDFQPTDQLVIPVHNSPKPPADRMTLTLAALRGAQHTVILTAGPGKAQALKDAQDPSSTLPIAQAARLTSADWYVTQDAIINAS